ncbi:uracil-DNA glycosylase [Tritonibacter scottomollicae]|uniref:uracil-DNA glycosylase n=1 Tax=Tritonibacter scottomollicae TaxID=483013 RepID=UPI003AA8DFCA
MSIDQFIAHLREIETGANVANPYNCFEQDVDATAAGFCQRSHQLSAYLRHRQQTAQVILVAEAPGYQGARFSGIAMTSERMLSGQYDFVTEQDVLGQFGLFRRTSANAACRNDQERRRGFAEPTATVVWRELMAANRASNVVLWNTFPFHPHRAAEPLSNRRPTQEEVDVNAGVLTELRGLFDPNCQIVAVGNVARDHLLEMGVDADHVRHPANGGVAEFRQQLQILWNLAEAPN